MQKESRFFKWVYAPLIAPTILLLLGSVITGKIVIQISGFQMSIGITLIVILCIFTVMVGSFILGMGYVVLAVVNIFTKQKMPLIFRIPMTITSFVLFPFNWIYMRRHKRQRPPSEFTQRMLARLQEKKEQQNEPPASTAK